MSVSLVVVVLSLTGAHAVRVLGAIVRGIADRRGEKITWQALQASRRANKHGCITSSRNRYRALSLPRL
jgi:hypothetical protein